jgi:Glycosyltransferase family 87
MLNLSATKPPNFSRIQWVLIGLSLLYFLKVYSVNAGDFRSYYHAGTKLHEGLSPYFFYIPEEGWVSMFSYPPFFALLMLPFSTLPIGIAALIWNILSLTALFRVYALIEGFLGIKTRFDTKKYRLFVFLTLLFTVRFILYNFDLTQSTLIVLWGTLESLKWIKEDKIWVGSLLLAGVISIKLLPLVMLPYLVYRAYFKAASLTVLFVLILNCFPFFIFGKEGFLQVVDEWWRIINPTNIEFTLKQNSGDETTHGLSAFVPAFFSNYVVRYGLRRHFIMLNAAQIISLLLVLRLFFIALTLYFLRSMPFKKTTNPLQFMWEISYLLMVIPLIFPQQMKYAFALLLPAFSYLFFYILTMQKGIKSRFLIALMSLVFILTTVSTDGIIGIRLYEYAQYYKLITWGTFMLIFTLAICPPNQEVIKN